MGCLNMDPDRSRLHKRQSSLPDQKKQFAFPASCRLLVSCPIQWLIAQATQCVCVCVLWRDSIAISPRRAKGLKVRKFKGGPCKCLLHPEGCGPNALSTRPFRLRAWSLNSGTTLEVQTVSA
eukprot:428431-Amphidinium_carterae.1